MNTLHYILAEDGKTPVVAPLMVWARWFGTMNRVIAQHMAGEHITVSTIFLGIDHNFGDSGPPILWETMAFDNRKRVELLDGRVSPLGESIAQRRYRSHDEALAGHTELLRELRKREEQAQHSAVSNGDTHE